MGAIASMLGVIGCGFMAIELCTFSWMDAGIVCKGRLTGYCAVGVSSFMKAPAMAALAVAGSPTCRAQAMLD